MGWTNDSQCDCTLGAGGARRRLFECRECGIVCQRVVSPWQCLRSSCPYVYSYRGDDATYFGCLYKIYAPELALEPFLDANGRAGRGSDPFGPLPVVREPRTRCSVWIERAYEAIDPAGVCCNRGFLHGAARLG